MGVAGHGAVVTTVSAPLHLPVAPRIRDLELPEDQACSTWVASVATAYSTCTVQLVAGSQDASSRRARRRRRVRARDAG